MNEYRKSFSIKPPFSVLPRSSEAGNAMIYVLVIIALFAALSFILARQSDTSETGDLSREKTEIYATGIIQTAAQLKTSIDQMGFTGSDIDELDFTLPSDAAFDTPPNIHKVFHPEGGGVILPRIQDEAQNEVNTDPAAGWYVGRFNDVEWTQSTQDDVIATAHQISQPVCEEINRKLTGSTTIPALGRDVNELLIDAALHSNGPNQDLTAAECAGCEDLAQICVVNSAGTIYSFYSIVAQQ